MIESEMVHKMLSSPEDDESLEFFTPDLKKVMQKLDSAKELVVELEGNNMRSGGSSSSGASDANSKSSVVVGVDEDMMQLTDWLTGTMQSKLEIVPIVGMCWIGKTTIARKFYHDSSVISRFQYARAWATISQDYNMKAILTSLLSCVIGKDEFDEKHSGKGSDELKVILYQSLFGRKYLIVLDDIWNMKFWDEIRQCFHDNDNGNRIVITTRESDVARYIADSNTQQHEVQLLSQHQSWNLLRQIVFGEENCCPPELEEIGKKIASNCGGLPLAIVVIGGLLSKLERSEGVWHHISTDVRGAIAKSDEQCSNILSLSYDHLPNHLKPCFLYMGAFSEDYEIKASRLIHLWVAEGFVVKSNGNNDKSLEEEAEDYLKALVERNLVFVKEKMNNGKAKSYNVHDLLRDLCLRKGKEDEFIQVMNEPKDTYFSVRRLIVLDPILTGQDHLDSYAELMSLSRSFIYFDRHRRSYDFLNLSFLSELGLMRVLDIKKRTFDEFPKEISQLVNLQYLAFRCRSRLPREISRLRNLHTLIADITGQEYCSLPCEIIWEMLELRHLKSNQPINIEGGYTVEFAHKNPQTLSLVRVTDSLISNGFFNNIPNIKDLGIQIDRYCRWSSGVVDLSSLHKLHTLRCEYLSTMVLVVFPNNLRNLHLFGSTVHGELLTGLCALPNLELLELSSCFFESKKNSHDDVWEMKEGDEFWSLRFLLLHNCHFLASWRADETNFPRLRRLVLENCPWLEEIHSIGEIPTLQLIEVRRCRDSVMESARRIVKEQQSEYDNYQIKLLIDPSY